VESGEVSVRRDELRQEEDEISIIEVASFVVRRRLFIVLSALVGVLLTLPIALMTEREYVATASFLPNGGEQGGFAGAAGLAAQFGFSMPRSGGSERSPDFYEALIKSREILDAVVRDGVQMLTPDGMKFVDLAAHFEIGASTVEERSELTRRRLAEEVVGVSVVRETGIVSLRVRTDAPELSAAVGWRLLDLISEFDLETRQSEASAERRFAEDRLVQLQGELATVEDSLRVFLDENRQFSNSSQLTFQHERLQRKVGMRQELVTAMAQAHEQARIDEVRTTPVVTIIDEPQAPSLPEPRGRLLKLLLGGILGTIVGLGLAFVVEYGERAESEQNEEYREFRNVLKDAWKDLFGLRRPRRPPPMTADSEE
jgi:uncharacterized protein involved in exopolysaccharide biosynthesis